LCFVGQWAHLQGVVWASRAVIVLRLAAGGGGGLEVTNRSTVAGAARVYTTGDCCSRAPSDDDCIMLERNGGKVRAAEGVRLSGLSQWRTNA
jgi:hypothetical protein